LPLEERDVYPSKHPLKHQHLYLFHGDEWPGGISSPVNPARTLFLKSSENAVAGHQHRTSQQVEHTAGGKTVTCWSLGCLCDLHPEFARLNRWNHGFGILHTGENWKFESLRIINGQVA
jgi:hypothetical protein